MPNLWTLGGLSLPELVRRTIRGSWQDDVFGQAGRMAFYHFLAVFPSLLVFLALSAHFPQGSGHMRIALQDLSRQVLPDQVSQLFERMVNELDQRALSGAQLLWVCAGALWAALNGTWAMIDGLNTAYEVEDRRRWRTLSLTIAGLTLSLGATGVIAMFLIFLGAHFEAGGHSSASALRVLEWLVLAMALSLSFAVMYRFAPHLRDPQWRGSMPGALCALTLWILSTFGARFYFAHVNNYVRSYGHLNGVVMLLLWLYVTNGAILIGGEMNSEIEKAAAGRRNAPG